MFTRPNEREPVQIARGIVASFLRPSARLRVSEVARALPPNIRVKGRVPATPESAARFIPPKPTLRTARQAAATCTGCDLYRHATQAVFGEGRADAAVVFVGEQPGDAE